MSTIAQNLASLAQCKADIRAAIIAKGVPVSDSDPFSDYATKIGQISGGGGGGGVVLPVRAYSSSILGTEVVPE